MLPVGLERPLRCAVLGNERRRVRARRVVGTVQPEGDDPGRRGAAGEGRRVVDDPADAGAGRGDRAERRPSLRDDLPALRRRCMRSARPDGSPDRRSS